MIFTLLLTLSGTTLPVASVAAEADYYEVTTLAVPSDIILEVDIGFTFGGGIAGGTDHASAG